MSRGALTSHMCMRRTGFQPWSWEAASVCTCCRRSIFRVDSSRRIIRSGAALRSQARRIRCISRVMAAGVGISAPSVRSLVVLISQLWRTASITRPGQAAVDVGARRVLLAHNSKFALARHKWYEPMQLVAAMSDGQPYALLTPEIGQLVTYDSQPKDFARWWENTL